MSKITESGILDTSGRRMLVVAAVCSLILSGGAPSSGNGITGTEGGDARTGGGEVGGDGGSEGGGEPKHDCGGDGGGDGGPINNCVDTGESLVDG